MIPRVMTSHPTVDWERRADSVWAVTREEMQASDMRSKIMESGVVVLGLAFVHLVPDVRERDGRGVWVLARKEVLPSGVGGRTNAFAV